MVKKKKTQKKKKIVALSKRKKKEKKIKKKKNKPKTYTKSIVIQIADKIRNPHFSVTKRILINYRRKWIKKKRTKTVWIQVFAILCFCQHQTCCQKPKTFSIFFFFCGERVIMFIRLIPLVFNFFPLQMPAVAPDDSTRSSIEFT